mgnify:FL=1
MLPKSNQVVVDAILDRICGASLGCNKIEFDAICTALDRRHIPYIVNNEDVFDGSITVGKFHVFWMTFPDEQEIGE